jgi:hypothetical protein
MLDAFFRDFLQSILNRMIQGSADPDIETAADKR